jgi:adenylylsulfate kinase-like enzyme
VRHLGGAYAPGRHSVDWDLRSHRGERVAPGWYLYRMRAGSFRAERKMVREMMAPGEFVEIHIDTPLAEAEARDVKGLYKKARSGQLKNFTGIDSPYEPPEHPEIRIDTTTLTPEQAADLIIETLIP